MTRRLALITLVGLASLAGCIADENDYKTWTKKLDDSHESERAVQKLEGMGSRRSAGRGRIRASRSGCSRSSSRSRAR
jgi:hypothetical protein